MKRQKPLQWEFSADAKANERLRSVQRLIRAIVRVDGALESHRRELLRICMYKITEAHGKWNLRYKSLATKGKPRREVTHEHVIPRKQLVAEILKAPKKIKQITEKALGCLVTKAEDIRLTTKGKGASGWERYRLAKIVVIDTKTGKKMPS